MFELKTLTDYSDEALLEELRRVASEFKGQRLTRDAFNELSRVHASTLNSRFGSWRNALDKAGINLTIAPRRPPLTRQLVLEEIRACERETPGASAKVGEVARRLGVNKTTIPRKFGKWSGLLEAVGLKPVPLGRRYSDQECFENIVALWTHYGRQPHFAELNRSPSSVGSKAYVRRWGGWRKALAAFITFINQAQPQSNGNGAIPAGAEKQPARTPGSTTVSASRTLGLALRYRVLLRDRFRCQICGRSPAKVEGVELHVDHIVPWSKGGANAENNLRALCFDCNLGKGAKTEEFP